MTVETGTATQFIHQVAAQTQLLKKSYHRIKLMSNLKESLGELLLYLQSPLDQKQERKAWSLFEIMLMQYIDIEYL